MRRFVAIQASSLAQAKAAAEKLGLPMPGHSEDGLMVRYVSRPAEARYVPTRVVFVEPRVERTIVDRILSDDARCVLAARARRAGVTIEQVVVEQVVV